MSPRVFRDNPMPLWAQVMNDLRTRAARGEFPEAFPSELALTAEYGVSRHTVRAALRTLRSAGILDAGPGRASRVVGEIAEPLGALYSIFHAASAQGRSQRNVLLRREVVARPTGPPSTTPGNSGARQEELLIERLRLVNEEPVAWDVAWLAMPECESLLFADLDRSGIYENLATAGVTIDAGEETIRTAILDDPVLATRLAVDLGTAVLVLDRTCRGRARTLERRRTVLRADRVVLTTTWAHGAGCRFADARLAPVGSSVLLSDAGPPADAFL